MLPAAASFKREGANRGAIASFLVSTPESGVDSIAVTYALLDPIMTVARPLAAFVTGISAGILENRFSWKAPAASGPRREGPRPAAVTRSGAGDGSPWRPARLIAGLRYGCTEIWADIALWFFAGLLLAGMVTVYVPESLSEYVLGGGIVSMLAMLLLGLPIYICATASTPIAAAFLLKGASPGAVLVFLLVGPATNMTSLSVLVSILGRMGTVRYLMVIIVVSVMFGLGLDWLYRFLGIEARAVIATVRETVPYTVKLGAAMVLVVLTLVGLYRRLRLKWMTTRENQFITGFPELHRDVGYGPDRRFPVYAREKKEAARTGRRTERD